MSCQFEEDLTAYLDRELPEPRVKQLEAHLAGCGECPPTLALLRGGIARIATLPSVEPSQALRRAVLNQIDEPAGFFERYFRPQVLAPALGLGAAAVLAVVWAGARGHGRLDTATVAELEGDPQQLELAANLEVLEDFDVVGMEKPEDLEVIENLDSLEGTP